MKEKLANISDIIIEYCLYGMILFIPKSKAAIEIFACLGIFVFLIKKLILKPDFKFLKTLPSFFLLLFIIFNALSIFNSGIYLKKSLIALICKWIEYALIFLLVQDTLRNPRRIRVAVYILLIFGIVVGIDGLCQRFLGFEVLWDMPLAATNNGLLAISGPFGHYNDFGAYLLVILSLVIGILLSGKFKIEFRFLLFFFLSLLMTSMLLTYSRGSWLGFILGTILILLFSRRTKLLVPLLSIFVVLLVIVPGAKERGIFSFKSAQDYSIVWHDADRFRVWGAAFRMIKENPFLGKGAGTFMDYFSKYKPNVAVQYAHNCFLQIWAEAGVFSLISFLAFVGSIFYQGIRKFKLTKDFVLLGFIGGMFGFLVHSFFDTSLYSLQLSVLFWTCMGLVSAKTRNANDGR